jgi:hypothetical protein
LYSFIYSNNSFGNKSLSKLENLSEYLLEIKLNNINQKLNANYSLTKNITDLLANNSNYLMKLSLMSINLNDESTVDNLCLLIQNKSHL